MDFGKNISGYTKIRVKQKVGDIIVLEHAEEIDEKKNLRHNLFSWYPNVEFQVDKLICSGKEDSYKPYFTYHGFRYVQIQGLREAPQKGDICAVFVHQDIERTASFYCSDDLINYIYEGGIRSTYSNLFYSLTDCPTREKLGWTNDSQATAEQSNLPSFIPHILTNQFSSYKKCCTDKEYACNHFSHHLSSNISA